MAAGASFVGGADSVSVAVSVAVVVAVTVAGGVMLLSESFALLEPMTAPMMNEA
ncbi:hypothetical protein [Streptomyces sp. SAI-208]|uniref:hypothetical protein n=1 Tax=Streptomyces sp. SAI-208 TaxID=2940550 RepID=UPI002473169B|nr:hypothetical protein [Streptomyces sp. SAI-208]